MWTKYTVAATPGSFAFAVVFLPLYVLVAPLLNFDRVCGYCSAAMGPVDIFILLLFPTICLIRDLTWKYYCRMYLPASYHVAQEQHPRLPSTTKRVRAALLRVATVEPDARGNIKALAGGGLRRTSVWSVHPTCSNVTILPGMAIEGMEVRSTGRKN
ncbi:hypothetical protein K439DRAFT_890895 [Ramaria rubella]|nr:hypothetical protein K439DRAFT_890895 [Ramaria rubella]